MKIKEVCKRTSLTERTIRYYVERQLIHPKAEIINGRNYLDYSEEDVSQLLWIAELRKLHFSIEDIIQMMDFPQQLSSILVHHRDALKQELQQKTDIVQAIDQAIEEQVDSVSELVERLSDVSRHYSLPQLDVYPNFARFDSETKEEKEQAYIDFLAAQKIRDKVQNITRPVVKAILILGCIAVLFGAVVLLSGIPKKIDKELPAVQFRINDETYSEVTSISIQGKLYKRWFTSPRFAGSLVIDNYEYTKTYELLGITFFDSIQQGWGVLTYSTVIDGRPELESLGLIRITKDFEQLAIWAYEPKLGDHKSTTDLLIAAPAQTREEAVRIYEQLKSNGH
ncbi:MerR family transcriptional regulator [Paenibacillus sp. GXUN7292]|uniref:MerR family transcriptional regulator n=1 Tax=Paenibacillus sp. GXUN7292 TaxID=3422499 RepID=UPI003D7EC663